MNIHRPPKVREEIHVSKGHMTIDEAVKHFKFGRNTLIKLRQRENFNDKSHRSNTLKKNYYLIKRKLSPNSVAPCC